MAVVLCGLLPPAAGADEGERPPGELRRLQAQRGGAWSVAFSPDGRQALAGGGGYQGGRSVDCTLRLWDLASGRQLRRFVGHTRPVVSVAYSPDGRQVLSGSIDTTAELWDARTGEELSLFHHQDSVWSVALAPDGRGTISGGDDGTVLLWSTRSGARGFGNRLSNAEQQKGKKREEAAGEVSERAAAVP